MGPYVYIHKELINSRGTEIDSDKEWKTFHASRLAAKCKLFKMLKMPRVSTIRLLEIEGALRDSLEPCLVKPCVVSGRRKAGRRAYHPHITY